MLDTAAIRVQRLEDRSAQVERGEMLDQTSSSSSSDALWREVEIGGVVI